MLVSRLSGQLACRPARQPTRTQSPKVPQVNVRAPYLRQRVSTWSSAASLSPLALAKLKGNRKQVALGKYIGPLKRAGRVQVTCAGKLILRIICFTKEEGEGEDANCAPSVRVQKARINTIAQPTRSFRPHPGELGAKSASQPTRQVSYGIVFSSSVIYSVPLSRSALAIVVRLWKLALPQAGQGATFSAVKSPVASGLFRPPLSLSLLLV